MMRLVDAYRRWRLRRWMRGDCYICGMQCDGRIVAFRGDTSPPIHVDLYACPDHFVMVRDFVKAQILGDVVE